MGKVSRMMAFAIVSALGVGGAQADDKTTPIKSLAPAQVGAAERLQIQARRDQLFKQMLSRPDDLDAAFEYAALSVKVGDLEGAISTLERMLIFAPGLPRLQLELGVLYYRLSAFETARSYFTAAVSGPDVPPEVRGKVEQYLAGIDRATEISRFTGQVRAGIRYQTNANRAPTDATIFLNGIPFRLDGSSVSNPDSNVYTAGAFHYSYDLPSQGDTIEADLVTYASKQFKRDELDVALAELTVGPAFDLGRFGIDNAAVGIYGIASGVVLNDHFYSSAFGVGTRLAVRPNPATSLLGAIEYRHRDYHDSSVAPTASARDGDELRVFGNGTYILNPNLAFGGTGYVQRVWADRGYLSYVEAGIAAGPRFAFVSPLSSEAPAWTAALNVGGIVRNFDDPDPVFSVTTAEEDWEAFVGGSLTVPLKDNFALITEVEYRHVDSNYSLRNFDNLSVALSIAKSF